VRAVVVGLAATSLLMSLACSGVGPIPSTAAHLEISNGTTLVITLAVNGSPITSVGPHSVERISPSRLPPLPWQVEARAASGRVLTSLTVRAGDVQRTTNSDGSTSWKGDAVRVDLSCGRLDVWSGPPLAGPVPGAGAAGDCDP
jgi:hypothetical protein